MYSAYQLSSIERERLLQCITPKYPKVYADHVTVQFGGQNIKTPKDAPLEIVGKADDNNGLEALIVRVGGNLQREDGKIFHITWSLDPQKKTPPTIDSQEIPYRPVHSNALVCRLINADGTPLTPPDSHWTLALFPNPIPIQAKPTLKYTSADRKLFEQNFSK